MPLAFDTALTLFWFGVTALNLSMVRRGMDSFGSFILWVVCFPVQESMIRKVFAEHPDKLWVLTAAALVPYLLAVCMIWIRVCLCVRWQRRA